MRNWLSLLLLVAGAAQAAGSGGVNAPAQRDKPYLILVSLDGFRWDYQDLYDTPALDRIAANGIRAERMIPVFPTLTFPNHYSIATGLYPANHRLIGNSFPNGDLTDWYSLGDREAVQDGRWYGGLPVWVAAEKAGMVTAAYYFVGTEAEIQGVPMTYWHAFDASVPGLDRVGQVLEWLAMPEASRPHLVTLYFEDVDTATHGYGPGSAQSLAAIARVDGYLGALLDGVAELPIASEIYLVVVSDHGQLAKKLDDEILIVDELVDITGLSVVDHGAATFIYFPQPDPERSTAIRDTINARWTHGKALLIDETPAAWRVTAEAGFAEVILQADPGYLVYSSADRVQHRSRGDHGWAPEVEGMHAIFLAGGPRLPKDRRIGPVNSVDVYPLMMEILGLPVTTQIDGEPAMLAGLLE
ncbi:MAG: ectonucleotide pyrophosphatase/phosphodiesterase [Gammaproteobacteria bacterium]|nr:ectonucleotide pyrophosphatase/phosphodiesterase [Gammaproteobacteria bacterium]